MTKPSDSTPPPKRPLPANKPDSAVNFIEWRDVIAKNFPTLAQGATICASVFTQLLINDVVNPFALALVDVPSGGKTITLNFFTIPELAYASDNFTPASFVSHASNVKREELEKVDLLPRIRYRTLIVRDLAPIFGAKEDDLLKTLGILTRVLDGEGYEADGGVHGKRGYSGDYLFMLLAGTPPIPARVFKVMGTLGNRLFFLGLHSPTKTDDELVNQNRGVSWREKEKACRDVTARFMRTIWSRYPAGVTWKRDGDPEECLLVIARSARLLASLRGKIEVYASGHDNEGDHSVAVIEQPDRINCLLYNLARGHAIVCGRDQLTTEDLAPVLEVTFDSAPLNRAKLIRALVDHRGFLRTSGVEAALSASKPTAGKEMKTLALLGVVREFPTACEKDRSAPPNSAPQNEFEAIAADIEAKEGRPEHAIELAPQFQWFASDECRGLRWKTQPNETCQT